jgi:hypothetical protein
MSHNQGDILKGFCTSNAVRLVKRTVSRWRLTIELQTSPKMTSKSSEFNADEITFGPEFSSGKTTREMNLIFLSRFLAGRDVRRSTADEYQGSHP